jgi:hypothetical protein
MGDLNWLAPPEDLLEASDKEIFYKPDLALLNIYY